MTSPTLRVPHAPPVASKEWFLLSPPPVGWVGSDLIRNAVTHNNKTYYGYIDADGNTYVAVYDHATRQTTTSPVIIATGASDVHSTPAVLIRSSDNKLVVAVIPHNSNHCYIAVSTNALDVSAWGAATDIASTLAGSGRYTYPCLFQLSGEAGKIYLFYRDQDVIGPPSENVLAYTTSTDGGSTWAAGTNLFKSANKYALWALDSDNVNRIDFVISSGSATQDATADLYHFYYDGSFKKSDGTAVGGSLPHVPADVTKIYDGATNGLVRIPYCTVGGSNPVTVWAAYDPTGSGANERYWYGIYTGGAWVTNEITDDGVPPSFTVILDGGLAINRADTTEIAYSKVDGTGQWQILHAVTTDNGATWTTTTLTTDAAQPNLRPICPASPTADLKFMWMYGPSYESGSQATVEPAQIRGYPNPIMVF